MRGYCIGMGVVTSFTLLLMTRLPFAVHKMETRSALYRKP